MVKTTFLRGYKLIPGHVAFQVPPDAFFLAYFSYYALPDEIPDCSIGPQVIILGAIRYDIGFREELFLLAPVQ